MYIYIYIYIIPPRYGLYYGCIGQYGVIFVYAKFPFDSHGIYKITHEKKGSHDLNQNLQGIMFQLSIFRDVRVLYVDHHSLT